MDLLASRCNQREALRQSARLTFVDDPRLFVSLSRYVILSGASRTRRAVKAAKFVPVRPSLPRGHTNNGGVPADAELARLSPAEQSRAAVSALSRSAAAGGVEWFPPLGWKRVSLTG